MSELKRILMAWDGLSSQEPEDIIDAAKQRVIDGENPEEVLHDDFGLEPDYFFDLVD